MVSTKNRILRKRTILIITTIYLLILFFLYIINYTRPIQVTRVDRYDISVKKITYDTRYYPESYDRLIYEPIKIEEYGIELQPLEKYLHNEVKLFGGEIVTLEEYFSRFDNKQVEIQIVKTTYKYYAHSGRFLWEYMEEYNLYFRLYADHTILGIGSFDFVVSGNHEDLSNATKSIIPKAIINTLPN